MSLHSLRPLTRPDNLKNQVRANQSLARKIYLAALVLAGGWIVLLIFGPLVFMEADGMVLEDQEVVMPSFSAQVLSMSVRPGDAVAAGDAIGQVVSTQMIDLISDLNSRKAQADARAEQIQARLSAIESMLPIARQRVKQADAAFAMVGKAMSSGFSTTTRMAEASRERFDAGRELAALQSEQAGLVSERAAVHGNVARLQDALDAAQRTYRNGAIVSPVTGTLGPRVVTPGTVLSPGSSNRIAEIYHGRKYILAYLPTNRIYSATPGQTVIVTDGVNRQVGHIEQIGAITDQLPAEFQSNFSSVERQQLARIAIDDSRIFPLLAKIKIKGAFSPSNLIAATQDTVIGTAVRGSEWLVATLFSDVERRSEHRFAGVGIREAQLQESAAPAKTTERVASHETPGQP